jgi:hypothetical protein
MQRRSEDRIMQLVAKALATHDMAELNSILGHLKKAIRDHCQHIRRFVMFPIPERRSGSSRDNSPS